MPGLADGDGSGETDDEKINCFQNIFWYFQEYFSPQRGIFEEQPV